MNVIDEEPMLVHCENRKAHNRKAHESRQSNAQTNRKTYNTALRTRHTVHAYT